MHVDFASSHVHGDYADGLLRVQVAREDPELGQTVLDELTFSVPPDYHVHNDLVAAALLTLVGQAFATVSFNFPISARCAGILRAFYGLEEVGPVDPALEPRARGRHLGLNFSGGTDSTAVWLLLTRIGVPFKVVTTDYGGYFFRERSGFEAFHRDITCRVDFRRKHYERYGGRFNSAVPLLFADYLDLSGIASGHNMLQNPLSIESLRDGRPPAFLRLDQAMTAGGLEEVHVFRSVTMFGTMMILLQAGPELIESAFAASEATLTWKYFGKAVLLRGLCAKLGLSRPAFVETLEVPPLERAPAGELSWALGALAFARRYDPDLYAQIPPELSQLDLAALDAIDEGWLMKYNPSLIHLIPADFRTRLLDELHALGIYPYTDYDFAQLAIVRQWLCATNYGGNDLLPEMCA